MTPDTDGISLHSHSEPGQDSPDLTSGHEAVDVSVVNPPNLLQHERKNESLVQVSDKTRSQSERENESLIRSTSGSNSQDEIVRKKSRRAPIILLSTLLSAIILAIAHDRMNHSLNGKAVDSNGPWNQQWTSRYGTALAFLARMFFVMCVGSAFVQRQWFVLSTRQQAVLFLDLDILSNALSTPLSGFTSSVWVDNPLLLAIALISWTLPFAAIVTPGTLSVEPKPYIFGASQPALQFDTGIESPIYSLVNPTQTLDNTGPTYATPGFLLSKLAINVVTTSQILPKVPMLANQTYSVSFNGPALRCEEANSSMYTKLVHLNLDNSFLEYLAWTGDTAPWLQSENLGTQDGNPILPASTLQNYTFYPSAPDVLNYAMESEIETIETLWIMTHNETVSSVSRFNIKECQLWNASYKVNFTYSNFQQATNLQHFDYQNPIKSISTRNESKFNDIVLSTGFHKGVLSAFASLMVGANLEHPKEAYQTSLATSLDLFDMGDSTQFEGALEEAFQKITLSLFSVRKFFVITVNDYTSTNITTWTSAYVYQQRDLILAYGISFLVSLLCCIVGLHSFHRNGSSFQNSPSTYIRAVENSSVDVGAAIRSGDSGADPLPKEIGHMKIKMNSGQII